MATNYNPSIFCPQCGSPTKRSTYEPSTRREERLCRDHNHYSHRIRPTREEEPGRRRNWLARSEQVRHNFQLRQERKAQQEAHEMVARLPKLDEQKPAPAEVFCPHCDSAETEIEHHGASGTDEKDIWFCECGARWELDQSERQ